MTDNKSMCILKYDKEGDVSEDIRGSIKEL
jgi:hypothetical protein